ncbi:MAG: hypothetical protein MAG795_00621 [Candidatus Woesearchaeota archaeon]|nr:hypothetical protein [Candidatus Woesearchaeota archaeon]
MVKQILYIDDNIWVRMSAEEDLVPRFLDYDII